MSDRRVDDETIIAGFKNLADAMATGFDRMEAKIDAKIDALRDELRSEFRNGLGGLEQRMMRRFDAVDGRLDDHEGRITALEAKP